MVENLNNRIVEKIVNLMETGKIDNVTELVYFLNVFISFIFYKKSFVEEIIF